MTRNISANELVDFVYNDFPDGEIRGKRDRRYIAIVVVHSQCWKVGLAH